MGVAIVIVLLICVIFYRFCWAICKPIFIFIYDGIVNGLMQTGMSKQAAKALISLIVIALIISIIF